LSMPYLYETSPLPVSNESEPEIPTGITLFQNYPNPFSASTTVAFSTDRVQYVRLVAFDMLGRVQAVLYDGLAQPGIVRLDWDPPKIASGTYLLRLEGTDTVVTTTVVVIR